MQALHKAPLKSTALVVLFCQQKTTRLDPRAILIFSGGHTRHDTPDGLYDLCCGSELYQNWSELVLSSLWSASSGEYTVSDWYRVSHNPVCGLAGFALSGSHVLLQSSAPLQLVVRCRPN